AGEGAHGARCVVHGRPGEAWAWPEGNAGFGHSGGAWTGHGTRRRGRPRAARRKRPLTAERYFRRRNALEPTDPTLPNRFYRPGGSGGRGTQFVGANRREGVARLFPREPVS